MELLSPAGNREALIAAIACGADAVYLGYTAFGARSYAGNFGDEELAEAVAYAHERGKRIYATVNTLVKDSEMDALCGVLELLCRTGVDAALMQDMGAVRVARERFPQLTLHASTQMTVNNAQGARLLGELGFARVVPARECTLAELRRMADTGVEIEAFAHGALCVAVSGQCLFSSMIGGRSGNRGRCAQPCRLPYCMEDGTRGYLLSTRDLMTIGHLRELQNAGVCSLKLEGRMKRPEYVGAVTRAYREALDALQAGVDYVPSEETVEGLKQVFNRGGFTKGYAMGESHAALMSWERPSHWGVRVGRIVSRRGALAQVELERALNDGDGLQSRGKEELEFTYSGKDVPAGGVATVRIAPDAVKAAGAQPGDAVYRLTDAAQMRRIRDRMAQETVQIPLAATLVAEPGELPSLTLVDPQGRTVRAVGEQIVDRAQSRPLDAETAQKQLGKTGGTPYVLHKLAVQGEGGFMTAGALNALRRDALAAMQKARTAVPPQDKPGVRMDAAWPKRERLLLVQGESLPDACALLGAGADAFLWQPQDYTEDALLRALEKTPDAHSALVLPAALTSQELDALHSLVCAHAQRFAAVVANNIGVFGLAWPVPVWGGQGLNVMNGGCAAFYTALGAQRLSASCELSQKELRELLSCGGNFEIEVYGRSQLMLLSHCPRRTRAGDTEQNAHCNACAKDGGCPAVYTDRKGYRFPARRLRLAHGCALRLYNSVPTDLARYADKLHAMGCSLRLSFTDEPLERQLELVSSYRAVLERGRALHEAQSATAGWFVRPVE